MTTPSDIITQALRISGVLGIGQSASAEDTNDAFHHLNNMMAQWQRKRWLIYHLITVSVTCTGAVSYTIGPTGNINIAKRPDRIESAFVRQIIQSQPNQVDYPLEIIQARETYNTIAVKQLTSFPYCIFYDSGYPLGVLYPWPVPQADTYQLHVSIKEQLSQFTSLGQTIVLPDEYIAALELNLSLRLTAFYKLPTDPTIVGLAKDSLNLIRGANTQIPLLRIPSDLIRPGRYDIYSDQIR